MMSSDNDELLEQVIENIELALNPPYIMRADGTMYRADRGVTFHTADGWKKKTLKEKVMGWFKDKYGMPNEPIQDEMCDAENVGAVKMHLQKIENRLKQLECEHGEYTYHRRKLDTFLWNPPFTIQYEKRCKECFKTTLISADEYYEAVTTEKYAEYEKVWEEWANADH